MWRSVAKKMPALTRAAVRSSQVAAAPRLAAQAAKVQARALSSSASDDYTLNLAKVLAPEQTLEEFKQLYRTPGVKHTTVIKIGGEVIINELETLIESLRFMRDTGLFPILVHGAGPQMNAELDKQGVEPQYVGGNRVTDQKTLDVAKTIFIDTNAKLVAALNKAGVPAKGITSGVIQADFKDKDVYGFVGEVNKIHGDPVQAAIDAGEIPVLSCLGESANGQALNINADVAARQLALNLQPLKTIFVNAKGGWIEDDGTKLKTINMAKDYARMAARDYTGRQGTLLKLNEINTLLQGLPSTSSVVLTSASQLMREIVSKKSAGTTCVRGEKPAAASSKSGANVSAVPRGPNGKFRVGLLGARGYVGRELIRVIGRHPELELVCASSRALGGEKVVKVAAAAPLNPHTKLPAKPVEDVKLSIDPELEFCELGLDDIATSPFGESVDVWVLALPNGYCEKYATALDALRRQDKIIIDLSADQRFNSEWTYGLPEAPGGRTRLQGATHIANPGCYATGAQLGLMPLLGGKPEVSGKLLDETVPPHVFGLSGYSGAGTNPSAANDLNVLKDNVIAYKSVNHIHEHEISHQLGTSVRFMPHVAPYFQGIHLTLSAQLADNGVITSAKQAEELYQEFFANEALVKVQPDIPFVKNNAYHPHATVGGFQLDPDTGRLVVIATIDNLLKGAATQAVQNINVALGIDEYAGIDLQ
ncbi:N-acetyl-gamma-glutamyl-phosphate reductase [Phytophthora cinnamomi]|uniref:N-acetyl-gamma-glutamyl-phosphate reductase n=1 Tax=Phytophthora cinnamomi TaxID=4785 RepID=UPI00355A57D0|nr:N-acetyl-gamma-glutamyl-phosphate reductase [Phytophthora cinnamomi]